MPYGGEKQGAKNSLILRLPPTSDRTLIAFVVNNLYKYEKSLKICVSCAILILRLLYLKPIIKPSGENWQFTMLIIEQLQETKAATLQYFGLPAAELARQYGPGKWTVREILHHLADAETILYDRIRRVIAEPKGVIWAFDQDLWRQELDYKTFPLGLNERIYGAVRDSVIYLAERHYRSHGDREFVHSQTGIRTLRDEFDKVAAHNRHHLGHIELALKR